MDKKIRFTSGSGMILGAGVGLLFDPLLGIGVGLVVGGLAGLVIGSAVTKSSADQ